MVGLKEPLLSAYDFREIDVYPTLDELQGSRTRVPRNVTSGAFDNLDHYLDTQFRLLREDFVASLREAIEDCRSGKSSKVLDIYKNVEIRPGNPNCAILIESGKEDKKFMSGSLVLFTSDNFRTILMGKVVQKLLSEVVIEPIDHTSDGSPRSCTIAECGNYFDPYYNVLRVLKSSAFHLPMRKYIVDVDASQIYLPKYLQHAVTSRIYQVEDYKFPVHKLPQISHRFYGLNDSQLGAFKAALTQEFVVIQGPPGTGKTYLGTKIIQALVSNAHAWYNHTPLLVIAYKNDALDQLLEELISVTKKLVRVGGQSKSEKLKPFYLNNIRRSLSAESGKKITNLCVMRRALVVGMTTALAVRWKSDLEQLESPIVVVEEAAEILEAHVVAALPSKCQHLIMLGDHQQLQPNTSNYNIAKNYDLKMSLFERMVRNGIRCYSLDTQHRMRPEISALILNIYPFLRNHSDVYARPDIRGVTANLFFLNHNNREDTCNGTSKINVYEARFLLHFAEYLIRNGYQPFEIAVLATYAGQVELIARLAAKRDVFAGVKVASVDGFQGQEAEVVLLSLVRSDELGFLGIKNRVCVALSRARSGMYVMGNVNLLMRAEIWRKIIKALEKQNAIGNALDVQCEVHKVVKTIRLLRDWKLVKNGWCNQCEAERVLTRNNSLEGDYLLEASSSQRIASVQELGGSSLENCLLSFSLVFVAILIVYFLNSLVQVVHKTV